jgi:hypothetical protein
MSDPTLPGTPGTGDVPEPEPEGFREEQMEAEKERQAQEQAEGARRSAETKAYLSGETDQEPGTPAPKTDDEDETEPGGSSFTT